MHWREWSDEAFAEARAGARPVLVFLTAAWCRFCRDLEELVLADPRVVALVHERFVPMRVDKDRRPDIDARYAQRGWPTLAYLDDHAELIATDSYLEVDELLARLSVVANWYAENRAVLQRRLAEAAERAGEPMRKQRGELTRSIVDWVAKTILDTSDPTWGGWGRAQKFPHFESLDFALVRWSQTGDEAMRKLVLRTLRSMQQGEIHDRVDGGFYRYATQPDWSLPHHEKMLDSNAQRLYAYLEGWQALGEPSFRETAARTLAWMRATLLDPATHAFRGSQDADPAFAHLTTRAARAQHGAPPCDPTIFADWNALAISALLKASVVLGEERAKDEALAALDFVLEELYDERTGVHHYWDGTYHLPGLLADQAYVLRALLDALQYTGDGRHLATAETLAGLTLESLADSEGGFFDSRHDPKARGGLSRRYQSILDNAVMAEALMRLAAVSHQDHFAEHAERALQAFAQDYKHYGHFVAGYARAVDLALHPPVHVIVVGRVDAADTLELARAALAPYVASRVVQVIDPASDARLLARSGLPSSAPAARAYLRRGRESFADTADPQRLPALMTRVERGS